MRSDVQELSGPVLEVLSGDLAGRSFAIDEAEFYIGRATSCDIVIPRRYISREHAKIVRRGGEWRVDGLSEKNPVMVRNRPARGHELADGDVFEMCGIRFRFVRHGKVEGRRGAQQRMSGSCSDEGGSRDDADSSWAEAETANYDRGGVSDSGPVSTRGGVSDSGPARRPDDSWADGGVSDSGPARRADSGSDTGSGGRSGGHSRSAARSKRVVFEVDGDSDADDASNSGLGSGTNAADQTAELGKADPDDPDYDPFADVEAGGKKKKKDNPAREKTLKIMLIVGAVGLVFACYFLYVITKPKEWQNKVHPLPIEVAVDEVVEFTYEWAMDDPPEGRRGTSLEGREYNWLPNNDYAYVEWAVPHIPSRSVFLIRGKAEGPTRFWLQFPNSRTNMAFDVQVTGEPVHELFREQRVQELRSKSARELRREIESRQGSGERLTDERKVEGKEGYYRLAVEEFQAATDAALALRAVLSSKGVVPKKDQDLVISCEDREKRAEREHEDFVARELALYRASVQRDGERVQSRQLRRVLRVINHTCDLDFRRLKLILEECYEIPFQEPTAKCPAAQ